ncbi:MAG TPA: MFS transporter [Candidatus Binataceae bacterium]
MTQRERQGWFIVASLFVTLFLVFGSGYDTAGLFFPQLLKHFGWSRTRISTLTGALAFSAGLSAPLIGWMLDRFEARIVMVAGAALSGLAFIMASQANSFTPMLVAYLVLGVGIGAATLLPAALVIANWFGARRGLAMGLTFAGTSLGGAGMTLVGNAAILHFGGWRAGYLTLAAPMLIIVIPLIIVMVRSRPPQAENLHLTVAQAASALPGLELGEAFRTRSFWMLAAAQFLFACVAAGTGLHLITYLIGLGYGATFAATMMSLVYVGTSFGKLGMGVLADRVSARVALAVNFIAAAFGMVLIFGVGRGAVLVPFVIVFGLTLGAPLVLIPLLQAECMGLKRYGSIGGISGIFNTLGAVVGPIATGRIYDATGSYSIAFEIFVVMSILGATATLACMSLESEQARRNPEPAAATA